MEDSKIRHLREGLDRLKKNTEEAFKKAFLLGSLLERAHKFIRKLGYCPHCERQIAPKFMSKTQAYHANYCRGCEPVEID